MLIRQRDVRDLSRAPHTSPVRPRRESPQAPGIVSWWPARYLPRNFAGSGEASQINNIALNPEQEIGLGQAWGFVGVEAISVSDHIDAFAGLPLTVTFWLKTSAVGNVTIIGFYRSSAPFDGFGVGLNQGTGAGKLVYWGGNGAGAWKASTNTVHDDAWHFCAVTVEGTTVSFFKDGIADGTAVGQQPTAWTGSRRIGSDSGGGLTLTGSVGDVRIYNRALPADTIWAMYDPNTRWDLYDVLSAPIFAVPGAGGGASTFPALSVAI